MRILGNLELENPYALLLALLAIPGFLISRRAVGRVLFSSLGLLPRQRSSLRARLSWLADALLALAVVAFSVALAGPRTGDHRARISRKGIAVMMVVDISGSMQALDLSDGNGERTRLDAVKEVFRDFVAGASELAGRPDDAIGIVSFARYADSRCPLTLDHSNVLQIAEGLELVTEESEDGTAIGDGLGLAVERLRQTKAKSKVAILLTDGVNNAGDTAPIDAANLAKTLGIKIYTIGAGTNGFAPVRVQDPMSGRSVLRQTRVEIDEPLLQAMAKETGGQYFRATDYETLRQVYQAIDRLERSDVAEERYLQYREHFDVAASAALLFAVTGWVFRATWLRVLP